jgi:hypothetical protein
VEHGVEQHPELAVVLPPVAGIGGEQHEAALSDRRLHDRRLVADLGRAAHQSVEDRVVAADEAHQHLRITVPLRHLQQRAVGVTHGNPWVRIAVEDRMRRLEDLGLYDRPRRVELCGRPRCGHRAGEPEIGGKGACRAERDEGAAGLDELLQLEDALEAHAAADVLRLAIGAE